MRRSKLTTEERLRVYEITLEVLEDSMYPHYVCLLLDDVADEKLGYKPKLTMDTDKDFPEFYAQKPFDAEFSWWPVNDKDSRIEALQAAIQLCKEALK